MASYDAIAATGQAIVGLLEEARASTDFSGPGTQIKLVQAEEFKVGNPLQASQGLTVYLYRVAPDAATRNLPPRTAPDGKRFRPSLPVNLHYLITPWATDPFIQHRLLGWAIRTLENVSTLPSGLLNGFSPVSPVGSPNIFRDEESIDVILEVLSMADLANILEVFKAQGQIPPLSVSYLARVIMLESQVMYPDRSPVVVRQFDVVKMQP